MNPIEREFVHDTYQKIAKRFDITRGYLWKSLKLFLDNIEPNTMLLEVGSGNGRNLLRRKDCFNIGIDLCLNFAKISNKKGIESIVGNNISLPFRDNFIDNILSIAVIHHFTTENRRLRAVNELVRVLKPGGKMLIQVWALEQPVKSRRKFKKQDTFVEFKSPDKKLNETRFYHVFKKNELDSLVNKIPDIQIIKSFWEFGNWVIILQIYK